MGRIKPNTSWTTRPALQSDVWYLLDDLSNIITDDLDNRILFHNGILYDEDTIWINRTKPTTSWT